MPEDISTLGTRKLLIAIARSCIGAHYLKGGIGHVPDVNGDLVMLGNTTETVTIPTGQTEWGVYYTAKNGYNRCSGKHGHKNIKKMTEGDINNSVHRADPDSFKWQRVVTWKNVNAIHGESCEGKLHFDCSGFVKWCLKQVIPDFLQETYNTKGYRIKDIRQMLETVGESGANEADLCAGDILIRKKNKHIGFATGEGNRVIQAEYEATGVVDTSLGSWEFHGRIPQSWWLKLSPLDAEE